MQLRKQIRNLYSEKEMSCLSRSSHSCRGKELWCTDKIKPLSPLSWVLPVSKNWGEFQTFFYAAFLCCCCELSVHDIRNTFFTQWCYIFLSKQQACFGKKCILQDVPHECWQILTPVPFMCLLNLLKMGLHLYRPLDDWRSTPDVNLNCGYV